MKTRILRITLGLVCVIAAFYPGSLSISLITGIVVPNIKAGPNANIHHTVILGGSQFQGSEIYVVLSVGVLAAIALVGGGLFLIVSRSDDTA
jgi:cytochrome bd-type quinol oxidase subunit 2